MDTFEVHPGHYRRISDGREYPIGELLGMGTFGHVYRSGADTILKVLRIQDNRSKRLFLVEATLQQKLHEKEPDVCPEIRAFGKVRDRPNTYLIAMEKYDGTVRDLLHVNRDPALLLEWMRQIARILKRMERYNFNHRDLKSNNMMYKRLPGGGYRFVLIDFGFSCATFDGVKYTGSVFFPAQSTCFRRSRDLGMMVAEILLYEAAHYPPEIVTFLKLLLTFKIGKRECKMFEDCPPDNPAGWREMYDFFNQRKIENPNTTPEGLLKAIRSYETGGLPACRAGFACPDDEPPHPPAGEPVPASPAPDLLDMAVVRPVRPCPAGKERNPATGRCRKTRRATPDCPPGKMRNPATRRCKKIA